MPIYLCCPATTAAAATAEAGNDEENKEDATRSNNDYNCLIQEEPWTFGIYVYAAPFPLYEQQEEQGVGGGGGGGQQATTSGSSNIEQQQQKIFAVAASSSSAVTESAAIRMTSDGSNTIGSSTNYTHSSSSSPIVFDVHSWHEQQQQQQQQQQEEGRQRLLLPPLPTQTRTRDDASQQQQQQQKQSSASVPSSSGNLSNTNTNNKPIRIMKHSEIIIVDDICIAYDRYWLRIRFPGGVTGTSTAANTAITTTNNNSDTKYFAGYIAMNTITSSSSMSGTPLPQQELPFLSSSDGTDVWSFFDISSTSTTAIISNTTNDSDAVVSDPTTTIICRRTRLPYISSHRLQLLPNYDDGISNYSIVSSNSSNINTLHQQQQQLDHVLCRICREGIHELSSSDEAGVAAAAAADDTGEGATATATTTTAAVAVAVTEAAREDDTDHGGIPPIRVLPPRTTATAGATAAINDDMIQLIHRGTIVPMSRGERGQNQGRNTNRNLIIDSTTASSRDDRVQTISLSSSIRQRRQTQRTHTLGSSTLPRSGNDDDDEHINIDIEDDYVEQEYEEYDDEDIIQEEEEEEDTGNDDVIGLQYPPVADDDYDSEDGRKPTAINTIARSSTTSRKEQPLYVGPVLPIPTYHPHSEALQNPMLKPCECSGSMAFVHYLCIEQWRCRSRHPAAKNGLNCETCHQPYTLPPPTGRRPTASNNINNMNVINIMQLGDNDWFDAMPPHVMQALRQPHIMWQIGAYMVRKRWIRPIVPVIMSPIVAVYCRARRLLKKRGVARRRWACSLCRRRARWKCVRCLRSYYCSRQCQNVSWHIIHKHVCYKSVRFWWSIIVYSILTVLLFPGIIRDPFMYDVLLCIIPLSFIIMAILGGGVATLVKKLLGKDIRGRTMEFMVLLGTIWLFFTTWGVVKGFFTVPNPSCSGRFGLSFHVTQYDIFPHLLYNVTATTALDNSNSTIAMEPSMIRNLSPLSTIQFAWTNLVRLVRYISILQLRVLHMTIFYPAQVVYHSMDRMLVKSHLRPLLCSTTTTSSNKYRFLFMRSSNNATTTATLNITDEQITSKVTTNTLAMNSITRLLNQMMNVIQSKKIPSNLTIVSIISNDNNQTSSTVSRSSSSTSSAGCFEYISRVNASFFLSSPLNMNDDDDENIAFDHEHPSRCASDILLIFTLYSIAILTLIGSIISKRYERRRQRNPHRDHPFADAADAAEAPIQRQQHHLPRRILHLQQQQLAGQRHRHQHRGRNIEHLHQD